MKKIFLLAFLVLGLTWTAIKLAPVVSAQVVPGQCGEWCAGRGCAGNMQCLHAAGTTQYFCVNPAGSQCTGANPCCELLGGGSGSTNPNVPSNTSPSGSTSPNVPSNTNPNGPSTKVTGTATDPRIPVSGAPLSPQCKAQCDLDNDGIITKADMQKLAATGTATEIQPKVQFCTQQCPFNGIPAINPSGIVTQPPSQPTAQPGGPVVGDCSGSTAGVPDGVVDLKDIEQFRKELTGDVATLACDFDKNGAVDILDFGDIREGFVKDILKTPTK